MADNSAKIAELRAILESGVLEVETPDGVKVIYDRKGLERQINRLMQTDNTLRTKKPTMTTVQLGGF